MIMEMEDSIYESIPKTENAIEFLDVVGKKLLTVFCYIDQAAQTKL